jgi:hypothetical protein
VLGPAHVWALGVGIVLVGEFMGWNFSVGKGGAYGALIACWVIGLLYTCVAMIDSEVTSTVAAAGGQYAQAKHIMGPLMAFNVGLYLVMAYTMLEAADALIVGDLLVILAEQTGYDVLDLVCCRSEIPWRVHDAVAQLHHHGSGVRVDRVPVRRGAAVESGRDPETFRFADGAALGLDRRDCRVPVRDLVLSRDRGHLSGRRGGALAVTLAAAWHDDGDHNPSDRGDADMVCLHRPHPLGISRPGDGAAL